MSKKLPPTWRTVELGDAVQIENVGIEPEPGHVYRYVGLEHIEQNTGAILAAPETDGAEIRSVKYRFEPSHILYGKLRPNLNKVALPDFDGICSTDILPLGVRTLAVREYVAFYLRCPAFVHLATTRASGTKMPRFGPTQFLDAPVPLPPVRVQRRVVEMLARADEIRRKRVEAETVAAAVRPSLFRHYFGDASTNPMRWPVRTLGEFQIDTRYGTSTRTELQPPGDPVLRIPNVIHERVDTSDLKYLEVPADERDRLLLREGDLLLVRTNGNKDYVGRCAVFDLEGDWLFASYLIRVRFLTEDLHPEYVAAYLRTAEGRREVDRLTRTSAGQYNLSAEGIRAIRLMVPPLERQTEYANRVRSLRALTDRVADAGTVGSEVLSSLVAHAFSGDLTSAWEKENADEIASYQRVHEELPRLVLVGLVDAAQREAAKRTVLLTALMKYAFVFQMQNRARQRLYAFRPYKYGPFASEIYEHLGVLEAEGLLLQRESSDSSDREWRAIELTSKGRAYAEKLLPAFDPELVSELADVAREYGSLEHEALLDRVYAEYPEFARRSVRGREPPPKPSNRNKRVRE